MNLNRALMVGTFTGLALAAGAAHAEALRPNIMILLDTSGSMLYNQAYDGSPLCNDTTNHTTQGQSSRVYNMKNAIRAALTQVGTDEANFGLMRFPQIENTNSGGCPEAHWSNGGSSTTVGGHAGCKMTQQSSSAPETTYGTWFDTSAPEAFMVPVTKPATGLKGLADTDYDPTGANITTVFKWLDQSDSGLTGTSNTDPELRIPPNSYTPLGRSMFYSRMYFENYVYPNDPKKACRQNILIIATDGAETCDETEGTSVDSTTCAQTPANSFGTFHPVLQACQARHSAVIPKGVLVYILTDNGLSTAEKATANQMAAAGGTGQAIFVTLTDTNLVKQALVDIIAKTVPPPELCNGVDDNCNGQIDEDVSNACRLCTAGNGIAGCGTFTIAPDVKTDPDNVLASTGGAARHCAVEACNCKDDNCNGLVDEGFAPNACGQPCGCALPTEKCDGLDNDCDGDIDEGFNVGASCTNNGVGACRRGGILICNSDGSGTVCDAPAGMPMAEVCNGIDDDCDAMTDEGTLPGVGEACGNGLGNCMSGTFICMNGQLVCNATGMAQAEVCDGKDNNCDGVIDNAVFPQTGQSCLCPGVSQAQIDASNGVCKGGHLVCRGTMGFQCEGCTLPSQEICDGLDNNCDGMTDTAAKCPSGFACRDGACSLQCVGGEFSCPSGYKCVDQFCIPQRCANVVCGADEICKEATGQCVDLCEGVNCASPKICVHGSCLDCNDPSLACTAPEICVGGVCKTDKCLGKSCPDNTYCSDGTCIDLCIPGKCAKGERCAAGNCMPDVCADVICNQGKFCNPNTGVCETDRCQATNCGAGMTCVSMTNTCKVDPCSTIQCPSDCWHCGVTKDGIGTCLINEDCKPVETKVGQKGGGGGCGCETAGGPDATSWLSLLALGAVFARRRRRPRT